MSNIILQRLVLLTIQVANLAQKTNHLQVWPEHRETDETVFRSHFYPIDVKRVQNPRAR